MMKAERLAISGELTSSVIHEIRNPLVSIGGFARNLYRSASLSHHDRDKLEIIMNEALRLEKYLENLQSKVSELNLEETDLNQVLEDNCQLLNPDLGERKVKLRKSFAPDLPRCMLDVVKIHEVFLNILQNSLEAIGHNGTITVRTYQNSNKVVADISDDGSGIARSDIGKIFTPFFTTKKEGSGLGLAMAHSIIKNHGGNISVTSTRNKGTTFSVSFPIAAVSKKE
jgi:two-component system sensor histidine kinase HydH